MVSLERLVNAANELERLKTFAYRTIIPQLAECELKLFRADGGMTKKGKQYIEYKKDQFEENPLPGDYSHIHFYYLHTDHFNNYGSNIYIKLTIQAKAGDSTCFYRDTNIWVGELDKNGYVNRVNMKALEYEPKLTTVTEQNTNRILKEELEELLRTVNAKLLKDQSN